MLDREDAGSLKVVPVRGSPGGVVMEVGIEMLVVVVDVVVAATSMLVPVNTPHGLGVPAR